MEDGHLRPGLQFPPTEEKLVASCLLPKLSGSTDIIENISDVDIYRYDPWELLNIPCQFLSEEPVRYFFCRLRYVSSSRKGRIHRKAKSGYWKPTGKDREIPNKEFCVALMKNFVFCKGNVPKNGKAEWVMHEYRIHDRVLLALGLTPEPLVLCKIIHKREDQVLMQLVKDIYGPHPHFHTEASLAVDDHHLQNYSDVINNNAPETAVIVENIKVVSLAGQSGVSSAVTNNNAPDSAMDVENYRVVSLAGQTGVSSAVQALFPQIPTSSDTQEPDDADADDDFFAAFEKDIASWFTPDFNEDLFPLGYRSSDMDEGIALDDLNADFDGGWFCPADFGDLFAADDDQNYSAVANCDALETAVTVENNRLVSLVDQSIWSFCTPDDADPSVGLEEDLAGCVTQDECFSFFAPEIATDMQELDYADADNFAAFEKDIAGYKSSEGLALEELNVPIERNNDESLLFPYDADFNTAYEDNINAPETAMEEENYIVDSWSPDECFSRDDLYDYEHRSDRLMSEAS